MIKIGFILLFSILYSTEPKSLDEFVENHLLLTKSKMAVGPTIWMDIKEGYLRNKAIHYANVLMDSLDNGSSSLEIAKTHFPIIDELRRDVYEGKDFEYKIKKTSIPNSNINYFSSSKD
ncbi:MAG: hypothetical protein HN469_08230 [Candidatus Marinimicrobia bacterium]|jgi:hypothetical protein|nr:hypothetical protein [Candidatus Neomarinimicrobiota bacterium]MBT7516188.1 hypothetical protein [Candidatus Neomarinimicrobiota bacterium]